jgi:hypothetical protein
MRSVSARLARTIARSSASVAWTLNSSLMPTRLVVVKKESPLDSTSPFESDGPLAGAFGVLIRSSATPLRRPRFGLHRRSSRTTRTSETASFGFETHGATSSGCDSTDTTTMTRSRIRSARRRSMKRGKRLRSRLSDSSSSSGHSPGQAWSASSAG